MIVQGFQILFAIYYDVSVSITHDVNIRVTNI